jgi:predicted permease
MTPDIRQAWRTLVRRPLLSITTIVSLSVGLGACITLFAALDRFHIAALPFTNAHQIITVWASNSPRDGRRADYLPRGRAEELVREPPTGLSVMAAYGGVTTTAVIAGRSASLDGVGVIGDFFAALGVRPQLGRVPEPSESQAPVVVISDYLWRLAFNRDRAVLGKPLLLFGRPFTVIGVMRRGSEYPIAATYWLPAGSLPAEQSAVAWGAVGRVSPDIPIQAVHSRLQARAQHEWAMDSTRWGGQGLAVVPIIELSRVADQRLPLVAAAVSVTMLLTLLNLANLMVARVLRRSRDSVVRAALGASHWAVVKPFFIECSIMAVSGTALALVLAVAGIALLARLGPGLSGIVVNLRVLAFALLSALLSAGALGLAPTAQLRSADTRLLFSRGLGNSTTGERGRHIRAVITASQLALSVILIAALGIMLKALHNFRELDVGYDAQRTIVVRPDWDASDFDDRAQLDIAERIARELPLLGYERPAFWRTRAPTYPPPAVSEFFEVEGRIEPLPIRDGVLWSYEEVSDHFFEALQIPIVEGRSFTSADVSGSIPVVIISQAAARAWWPGRTALGKRIRLGDAESGEPWLRVVGVVRDVQAFHSLGRVFASGGRVVPRAFRPAAQAGSDPPPGWSYRRCFFCSRIALAVPSSANPARQADQLRTDLAARFPELRTPIVRPLIEDQLDTYGPGTFAATSRMLAPFGFVACVLTLLGIVGIIADSIARRTKEIGIRMALGARRHQVVLTAMRDIAWPILLGGLAGITFTMVGVPITEKAFYLGGFRSNLPGTSPTDLSVVLPVAFLLLLAALVVGALAARRAGTVEPMAALRSD